MDETKQAVPDFMIWHCAGCEAPAVGKTKPCDCGTNVGTRKGPNGKLESTWWDEPIAETTVAEIRKVLGRYILTDAGDDTHYFSSTESDCEILAKAFTAMLAAAPTTHVAVKREMLEEISSECAKCYKIMGGNIEHAVTQYGYGLIWSKLRALLSQKGE